jgi:arginine deiminase
MLHARTDPFSIEGGDVLVRSPEVVAIGIPSARTACVEALAQRLICEETASSACLPSISPRRDPICISIR